MAAWRCGSLSISMQHEPCVSSYHQREDEAGIIIITGAVVTASSEEAGKEKASSRDRLVETGTRSIRTGLSFSRTIHGRQYQETPTTTDKLVVLLGDYRRAGIRNHH